MSFIETEFLQDDTICDKLISYFTYNSNKHTAMQLVNGESVAADPKYKSSTDITVTHNTTLECPALADYLDELDVILSKYVKKWPSCDWYSPWSINTPFTIQHYKPGQGFYSWHTERCGASDIAASRHLVFMTYLNTVTDNGGTEFLNQNLMINAEKGKTVIWPADWTHTHRGVVSNTQDKYVITGWFNYDKEI